MKNQPFFFIQMTDPQFGMFPTNGDIFQETKLFEKAIEHVNRLKPAFVINTGDLVNEPTDDKQLNAAMDTMRNFDKTIPYYTIPGNHDIGDAPTEKSLNWYRKSIGKDWYSFDYGRWHFIGLNSCIIADGKHAAKDVQEQFDWLNNDLQQTASNNSHTIVFMHHPLFLNAPDEADDYFNIPQQTRRVYLALFRKYGVKTVFAGHLHQNNAAADSQLEVITTRPVGMPLGTASSGLRIIKVYNDHVEHKYFNLKDKINCDF